MNQKNFISLDLARKLSEAGCELESEYVYVDTRKSWKEYNCPPRKYPEHQNLEFVPFWQLDEGHPECELVKNQEPYPNKGYNDSKPLSAFSYYDILVMYAEEFFGNRMVCSDCGTDRDDCVCQMSGRGAMKTEAMYYFPEIILIRLKREKESVEDYIWQNCLFNL